MTYRVAMDIGGTFTDVVVQDRTTGKIIAAKAPTTPGDLTQGVFNALNLVVLEPAEVEYFVHGTTQGLNALLERRGARTFLVSTQGMRDTYQIARGHRTRMFDHRYRKPNPLIPRSQTSEVRGRIDASGTEIRPLDESGVRRFARFAKEAGAEAVVVSFLFSYLNPIHELETSRILREELGDEVMIVLSHEVASEWREYERTSSGVLEGYTGPVVQRYLNSVQDRFAAEGIPAPVHVMQSSGGVVSADHAKKHPLQTLLSGPVGGTMGGAVLLRETGRNTHAICIDMGGTSFDVSLVIDGSPDITTEGEADGFPVLLPLVNLHTIGAGGGSIAYTEGGGLRVGPTSSGAVPGPACYGRGGVKPTVTDAMCLLGRVDPTWFAGGTMTLDVSAARLAIQGLADELGMDLYETAEGIVRIATASMAQAIRTLTVERGLEPEKFMLIGFGGAGPMHAADLARELGVREVVIPRMPGAFSAWGMLVSPVRRDRSAPFYAIEQNVDYASLCETLARLEGDLAEDLSDQGVLAEDRSFRFSLDIRYQGQDNTLPVALTHHNEPSDEGFSEKLHQRFAHVHEARYGHSTLRAPLEIVAVRGTGLGPEQQVERGGLRERANSAVPHSQSAVFDGMTSITPIFHREGLIAGTVLNGPAIIVETTSTTVVPPGCTVLVDEHDHLTITLGESA